MSGDSFKVDLSWIKRFSEMVSNPALRTAIEEIPKQKAIAALISQAITDNFNKQGPGWKPLSPAYLRSELARLKIANPKIKPKKMILQKTGLLKKSVTTPGAKGNIYRTEGNNIIWGTNLAYAAIHNRGGVIKIPEQKNGFGIKGLTIKAHSVKMPARPFLVIRDMWKDQIKEFAFTKALSLLKQYIKGLRS
jgi:phage gpG-like protein